MTDITDLDTSTPSVDAVKLLARRWPTLLVVAVLGAGAALAYGLMAPNWYVATLTVVPAQATDSAMSSLAAKLPIAIDTVPTTVQRIDAVLNSTSVADEVIEKFKLEDRYDVSAIEFARAALWGHCSTTVNRKASLVSLSCEDKDPKAAMEIAAYFGEVGNRAFGRISASSAREERKFLETQVTKARADVEVASQKLREFQEQHKIIDLSEQSKAVISAMASIKGELVSKQLELSYLTSFSSRTESGVVQLQQQIAIMSSKLSQLEASQAIPDAAPPAPNKGTSAGSNDNNSQFFPGAMSVPELRLQLEYLLREQKISETIFFLMSQRYAMAKVDEARDTSTFQILDQPTLPTIKSRPHRMRIAVLGLFGSLAIGCALILVPAWLRGKASKQ
jgi:uncharacterized protein involved in exopolysaccharide biosynthesis